MKKPSRRAGAFDGARGRRGVTLIELVTVLVIIGIVVTIALPSIDLPRYRIEGAIQAVGTTLLAAQQYAVSRQHDVVVQLDVAAGALRLHYDADNDGVADSDERTRVVPLGEGVVFGRDGATPRPMGPGPITFTRQVNGVPAVIFRRNGSASEAGGIYLTSGRAMQDPQHAGDTRALEIERGTGRTSWLRWNGSSWQAGF